MGIVVYIIGIYTIILFGIDDIAFAPFKLIGKALGLGGPKKVKQPITTLPDPNIVVPTDHGDQNKPSFAGKLLKGLGAAILVGGAGYGAYKLTDSLNKPANNVNIPGNYTTGTYMNRFGMGGTYPMPGCFNGYGMMMGGCCCPPMPPCNPNPYPPPTNAFGLAAGGRPYSMSEISWDYQQMFGPLCGNSLFV